MWDSADPEQPSLNFLPLARGSPMALNHVQGTENQKNLSGVPDWQAAVTQKGKGPSKAFSESFKFTRLHIKHFILKSEM